MGGIQKHLTHWISQNTLAMFVGVAALRYQFYTTQSEKTGYCCWSCPWNESCAFKIQNSWQRVIAASFVKGVAMLALVLCGVDKGVPQTQISLTKTK